MNRVLLGFSTMDTQEIKKLILEKFPGVYFDQGAEDIAKDIEKMKPELKTAVNTFLTTGELPDYEVEGYTVEKLVEEYGLNEIAAFLTLDWITREPEKAIAAIERGYDKVT